MWFISSNNQQTGPFDERDIAVGLAQGVYNAHTMVWREGLPQWAQLAHSELAKYLPKVSMPPMPTPIPLHAQQLWSPGIAAVLSLVIPGAGQMYKGQIANGLVWLICVVIGYFFLVIPGLILHFFCILGAAAGDSTQRG